MRKHTILIVLLTAIAFTSCKKSKTEPETVSPSTQVVTGQVYGKNFVFASGKANKKTIDFGVEGFEIFLSAVKGDGCGTSDANFPVIVRTGRQVGKYPEYYAILSDLSTGDYRMFTDGNIFEITSVTATTVKGYIKVRSSVINSSLEGNFEATICN